MLTFGLRIGRHQPMACSRSDTEHDSERDEFYVVLQSGWCARTQLRMRAHADARLSHLCSLVYAGKTVRGRAVVVAHIALDCVSHIIVARREAWCSTIVCRPERPRTRKLTKDSWRLFATKRTCAKVLASVNHLCTSCTVNAAVLMPRAGSLTSIGARSLSSLEPTRGRDSLERR